MKVFMISFRNQRKPTTNIKIFLSVFQKKRTNAEGGVMESAHEHNGCLRLVRGDRRSAHEHMDKTGLG